MQYRKYRNKKVMYDRITFDSKLEGMVYLKIKELSNTHKFKYRLQPKYLLQERFKLWGKTYRKVEYIADFEIKMNGKTYTLDAKGVETDIFRLKHKMFVNRYQREIIRIKSVKDFSDWFKTMKENKENI